jgi:hypothetical protein
MKRFIAVTASMLLAGVSSAYAWSAVGHLYCDANLNNVIDSGDVPVQGALVVVTNISGTFSNASFSDAEGFYDVTLSESNDQYVGYLVPTSLPGGGLVILPAGSGSFQFSMPFPPSDIVTNDFLIRNLTCVSEPTGKTMVTGLVQCAATYASTNVAPIGLADVTVIITNLTSSFSNATVTAANGSFSLTIPSFNDILAIQSPLAQIYVEALAPSTLPADSTVLIPAPLTNLNPVYFVNFGSETDNLVFTSGTGESSTGDWLIESPSCHCLACALGGSGTIAGLSKKTDHSFGGSISASTSKKGLRIGHWTHVALTNKLLFQATAIHTVTASIVPGAAATKASAINMAEFSGQGTLKGIRGNKAKYASVLFTARVEDHGQPGRGLDRYYLRVYSSDGTTLLLVSDDASDPSDIATVPISTGNLTIRQVKGR